MANFYGIDLPELPEGAIPIDMVMLFKWVDPEGKVKYSEMKSAKLHPVEALGMLTTAVDSLRALCMNPDREY